MLTIKVLGPGCDNCRRVEAEVKSALAALAVEGTVIKVTGIDQMAPFNLLATPGLVVNERLVSAGRIPRQEEIMRWLKAALAKPAVVTE